MLDFLRRDRRDPRDEEIQYLRKQLESLQERYFSLQDDFLRHLGVSKEGEKQEESKDHETKPSPIRLRGWRQQRAFLEKKFRPPELEERERQWREIAEKMEKEMTDAGQIS